MSNVKSESGIRESQEAIDDFISKQKSANTNKKMATDLNTFLHFSNFQHRIVQQEKKR